MIKERMNSENKIEAFRKGILTWAKRNFLSYPWRESQNPYHILIAEILLHRTRVEQVVPLYTRFIEKFPDIYSLARADPEEVRKLLYSAGLRWRIELMLEMAKKIVLNYNGEIPFEREKLLDLPGISNYIASAVRCFAFGYPEPILDTNTVRILGRVFGLRINDTSRRSRKFKELMERIIDRINPDIFNYALLDLGKVVCKKNRPRCEECLVSFLCDHYKIENMRGRNR
jgi:A/G-specific adenine glycosylase